MTGLYIFQLWLRTNPYRDTWIWVCHAGNWGKLKFNISDQFVALCILERYYAGKLTFRHKFVFSPFKHLNSFHGINCHWDRNGSFQFFAGEAQYLYCNVNGSESILPSHDYHLTSASFHQFFACKNSIASSLKKDSHRPMWCKNLSY